MNKKIIWVIIILILVVGSAFYFITNKPSEKQQSTTTQSTTQASTSDNQSQISGASGSYVDYSQDAVKNAQGQKILFFYASWCPQCRELEASIKKGEIPDGVTIFKVDYDSNQALRKEYGVTLQTTLVKVDDQGNEISKFVAYDEPSLQSLIKNLL